MAVNWVILNCACWCWLDPERCPIPGSFTVGWTGNGPLCVFPPDQPDPMAWYTSYGPRNDVAYVLQRIPLQDGTTGDIVTDAAPCVACYSLGDLKFSDIVASLPVGVDFPTTLDPDVHDPAVWMFEDVNVSSNPGPTRYQYIWRSIILCGDFDPDSPSFGEFCIKHRVIELLFSPFNSPYEWSMGVAELDMIWGTVLSLTTLSGGSTLTTPSTVLCFQEPPLPPWDYSFDVAGRPPFIYTETQAGLTACYYDPIPGPPDPTIEDVTLTIAGA